MTRHDSGGWRGPPGRGSEEVQSRRECGGERIVGGEQGLVQDTSDGGDGGDAGRCGHSRCCDATQC